MSTGKRLAKRSILGTRVVAQAEDGFYYAGVIAGVKSPSSSAGEVNRYTVRFEPGSGLARTDYSDQQLIGPGFQTIHSVLLLPGQRVYITYNGREISGSVISHNTDEVIVSITLPNQEVATEIRKRLEDVRLAECRKSARLQDQDTDYSRLADMAGERRRTSHTIDVPLQQGSRKRRTSTSHDEKEDLMDECTAAMVLMHLSCSPHSPSGWLEPPVSPSDSWRSGTPSPPLSDNPAGSWLSTSDEGIVMDDDFDDIPKKKKAANRIVYQCTWPGCSIRTTAVTTIESHVRNVHLGPKEVQDGDEGMEGDDHEEEFYYTEVEIGMTSPTPTLSHLDMVRPPHEDPEYQKALGLLNTALPITIPKTTYHWSTLASVSPVVGQKQMKLSLSAPGGKYPSSPRRLRGETKKCRKVYGMEHRELWCTQCKWKKACSRFGD